MIGNKLRVFAPLASLREAFVSDLATKVSLIGKAMTTALTYFAQTLCVCVNIRLYIMMMRWVTWYVAAPASISSYALGMW